MAVIGSELTEELIKSIISLVKEKRMIILELLSTQIEIEREQGKGKY